MVSGSLTAFPVSFIQRVRIPSYDSLVQSVHSINFIRLRICSISWVISHSPDGPNVEPYRFALYGHIIFGYDNIFQSAISADIVFACILKKSEIFVNKNNRDPDFCLVPAIIGAIILTIVLLRFLLGSSLWQSHPEAEISIFPLPNDRVLLFHLHCSDTATYYLLFFRVGTYGPAAPRIR